jgi:hypothetical protein
MEPVINADLSHSVAPPADLTLPALRDIGWFADADLDGLADNLDACSTSILTPTIVIAGIDSHVPNTLFTSGCTISDFTARIAAQATSGQDFVHGVKDLALDLRKADIITEKDRQTLHQVAKDAAEILFPDKTGKN